MGGNLECMEARTLEVNSLRESYNSMLNLIYYPADVVRLWTNDYLEKFKRAEAKYQQCKMAEDK